MSKTAEDMLSAISGALAPEGEQPETETPETPEGEQPETETPETPEGEQPEGEGEQVEGEEAEGEERPEGEGEESQLDDKGKPKKPADPINDPLPKGTLQSTSERFKHVVGKLKEVTTQNETLQTQLQSAVEQHNTLVKTITETGLDATTFNAMLGYARNVNSGDPAQLEAAYNFLMEEVKQLGTAIGKPLPGTNPLADFPDLVKAVDEKKITPELAIETANARRSQMAHQKLQQAGQTRTQTAAQAQAAHEKSLSDLTALGNELVKRDGPQAYKAKFDILVPQMKGIMKRLKPEDRAEAFREAYDNLKLPKPAAAAPKKVAQQPLRGNKAPSGNGSAAPKSMLDAVSMGIDNASN